MPNIYDIGQRIDPSGEGVISTSPFWVICVIRFKNINTYDRLSLGSISVDGSEVASELGDPLVITSDCINMTTFATKSSHVSNMVATLLPGTTNYLSAIMPGDWVLSWMVQDEDVGLALVDRIKAKQACNNWMDGLKFIGRVQSIRKSLSINPQAGTKTVHHNLQALGFSEFDCQCFFDPYLSQAEVLINTWLGKMGNAVHDFLSQDGVDVNKAIPQLVELLFGRGVGEKAANPSGLPELQAGTGLVASSGDAPFAYVVPSTVGALLGKQSRSKSSGVLAFADLLESSYGIQRYDSHDANPWSVFIPSDLKPMLGRFLPSIPQFSGRSVWSILGQFLNPAVNEMYTALRVNSSGSIVPTLTVRQLPFTTDIAKADDRTSFMDLPRWIIPTSMIYSYDLGRSDALRFNFVHMLAEANATAQPNIYTYQLVRSPPIRDDQDIRRSGLRMDMQQINAGIAEQQKGPAKWTELRADWTMGGHLLLTGSLNCLGIQEPICPGDNIELDSVALHIESVTHTCGISSDGKKQFMTSLQLGHGLRADPPPYNLATDGQSAIFTATHRGDAVGNDPGMSYEGLDQKPAADPPIPAPQGVNNAGLSDFFGIGDIS